MRIPLVAAAALVLAALPATVPMTARGASQEGGDKPAANAPGGPLPKVTVTAGPSAEQQRQNNMKVAQDLLSQPDGASGEVPYRSLPGDSGRSFDIWAGPVMKSGDVTCRYLLLGSVVDQRVDQSMVGCRGKDGPWSIKSNPEHLPDAHKAMLVARLGELPKVGVGINPMAAKK